ncbi:hypothetical protein, partial [Gilliamella sp. WF3-4]|uniref:hypothetical protein n=1 Tax=Gilliamella sp. WF3-4 TaxID=3120255 RepID=UPI00159EBF53
VAYFSTGFTLVRHQLQMPKVAKATDTPPSITLYSLYMHQLDWYGYQQKEQESDSQVTYPHYWQAKAGEVDEKNADTIAGSVIRENGKNTKVVGLLLKGSKVRLGEQKSGMSGWYKIVSITAGAVVTPDGFQHELSNITGYVWHKDIGTTANDRPTGKTAETNKDYEICREDNKKVGKPEVEIKGIAIYGTANDSQKLTYLPKTATFEFDGQENGYAKICKIGNCTVPAVLVVENGGDEAPHKGYVKLTSLIVTQLKPEKLDKVVVLKAPVPIDKGDFIGYIGHNVSQSERFDEPKVAPLSTMKRALDKQLPPMAHIELLTCDDLPAFITKTRSLADKLPESEKTIILVEKEAQLVKAAKPAGCLSPGVGIHFTDNTENYYIKIKPVYTFNLPARFFYTSNAQSVFGTEIGKVVNGINGKIPAKKDASQSYTLTASEKKYLMLMYHSRYPELTEEDIPDKVELVSGGKEQDTRLPSVYSEPANNEDFFTIRFTLENKPYWIELDNVLHLQGKDGQLNSSASYWHDFPLSLANIPTEEDKNTVLSSRTLSLNALAHDGLIAIDEDNTTWVKVTALDKQSLMIHGWVNIKDNAQAHIKRCSPWHWPGFETIEEKASIGELSNKIGKNKVAKLDLEDYTPAMHALHQILTGTLIYSTQRKKGLPPPTFTERDLKEALRRSWAAELIGHLLVKYESEWYADEALSKWNEVDDLFEEERQQKKEMIEAGLNELGITQPYLRDYAFKLVDEAFKYIQTNWKIEKEQRIKPSLWWKEVAQAQAQNPTANTDANTPKLSNLSADGK